MVLVVVCQHEYARTQYESVRIHIHHTVALRLIHIDLVRRESRNELGTLSAEKIENRDFHHVRPAIRHAQRLYDLLCVTLQLPQEIELPPAALL